MTVASVHNYVVQCLLMALGLFLVACNGERPDETELLIVYSSDVMNYSLPYDFLKDKPSDVCQANFASYVKEKRHEYGENCLVFDNGNKLLGSYPAGYFNYIDLTSEPLAFRTERIIGYDAVGVGDKDLDVPILMQQKRWSPAIQPPLICANLINPETGDPVFQPYKIFDINGIRVAIMGLVSPNLMSWLPDENRQQIDLEDMIESARKWMPVIKEQNPDLIIGLFGASFKYQANGNTLDTYKNPNGSVPAAIRVPGFDLVLMGGSADREVFEVRNDEGDYVTCIQCGSMSSHCGEVRVGMQLSGDKYNKQLSATIVDLKQYEPDPDYCRQLEGIQDTISTWMKQQYGILADTLYGTQGFYGSDDYRQLIHRAQLWFSGADISLTSCLIGTDTIMPGPLNTRSLFQLFPYSNHLELMELQGVDVLNILEYSAGLQFATINSPDDELLLLKHDRNGNPLYNNAGRPLLANLPRDFTSAYGIRYTIDVTKPAGHRVRIYSMADGRPFDLRKNYKVAINSFQGKDGSQFFSKGLGWDRATIDLHAISRPQFSVRYALQEYVKAMSGDSIRLTQDGTWRLVPETLVSEVVARKMSQPLPVW